MGVGESTNSPFGDLPNQEMDFLIRKWFPCHHIPLQLKSFVRHLTLPLAYSWFLRTVSPHHPPTVSTDTHSQHQQPPAHYTNNHHDAPCADAPAAPPKTPPPPQASWFQPSAQIQHPTRPCHHRLSHCIPDNRPHPLFSSPTPVCFLYHTLDSSQEPCSTPQPVKPVSVNTGNPNPG